MNWKLYERLERVYDLIYERQLYRWILGTLAGVVLFFFIMIQPAQWLFDRVVSAYHEWNTYARTLAESREKWEKALHRLRTARSRRQQVLNDQFLPESAGFNEIRTFLEELSRKYSIQKTNISYDYQIVKGLQVTEVKITVPASGTYNQIRQFIREIEKSERFIILESIRLRSRAESATLRVDFVLRTYFRKSEQRS